MDIPKIVTPDGYISSLGKVNGSDRVEANFHFPDVSDYIIAQIKNKTPTAFIGRSGNAQIGIQTDKQNLETLPVVEGKDVFLDGLIQNLNPLLRNSLEQFKIGDEVGRLIVLDPELRIRDVRHYLHKRLFVGRELRPGYHEGFDIKQEVDALTGKECDFIEVELEPYQYAFEKYAISASSINAVIKDGRNALNKIRSRLPVDLKNTLLQPNELFIGAIKISLGDIYAVIDSFVEADQANVIHLSARVLDPHRTFRDRQIEIYNQSSKEIALNKIKIRIRFFRAKNPLTVPLESIKVKNGYRLYDLLTNSEIANLFEEMDLNSLGMILNKSNLVPIPKALNPEGEAQLEVLKNSIVESTYRKKEVVSDYSNLKQTAQKLSVLGGINSRIYLSLDFPSLELIDEIRRRGIRTFLIKNINPTLDDAYIKRMIQLTHIEQSACEFLRYDPELDKLYTFYHGCFLEANDRERFDKVKYWFAFYGSHTDEADNKLTVNLINQLAQNLGEEMGIVHGGGPGIMKESNDLARKHNIMSIGIAIDLEGENQKSLTTCDGLIKYKEGQRLSRQDHLQKLANIPIVNTGGYGTAEELAITITSMKIHENPLAPIILLDPNQLWEKSRQQTIKIAQKKYGPDFIPQLIKSCPNAQAAISELKAFLFNATLWYEQNNIPLKNVRKAQIKAQKIRYDLLRIKNPEVFQ